MNRKNDLKKLKIPFKFPVSIPMSTPEFLISRTINPKYEILGTDDKGTYTIDKKDKKGRKRYLRFRKVRIDELPSTTSSSTT